MLTTASEREYSVRVAVTTAIGFDSLGTQGAQPPRGFFCACLALLLWRAGRGSRKARRFLVSGLSTLLGSVTLFDSRAADVKPPHKESLMACTPSAPTAHDLFEEVDTHLYHLSHLCNFIEAVSSAQSKTFTDGIPFETIAVVFGFLADQMKDARAELQRAFVALRDTQGVA